MPPLAPHPQAVIKEKPGKPMPSRIAPKYFLFAFLALFFVGYYTTLIISAKPKAIETDLVRSFEAATEGKFQFSRFRLFYFPVLQTEFSGVDLEAHDPMDFTFKAKRIKFYFSFWAFLFGRAEVSKIVIDGGELHLPAPSPMMIDNLDIHNLRLRIRLNTRRREAVLHGQGDLEGIRRSLSGKAKIAMPDFKKGNWAQTSVNGDIVLKNFPAAQFQYDIFKERNITLKEGVMGATLHFYKDRGNEWLQVQGKSEIAGLVYEVQDDANRLLSPQMNIAAEADVDWSRAEKKIFIKRSLLTLPFAKAQLAGTALLASREVKDMRLIISEVMLESIPQYYLPFKEAIPFNFGFSGRSDLEMALEGNWDNLALHANWDLTPSLLTYAGYFAKPKETPLNLIFDCVLTEGHELTGDFSLKIEEVGLKGAITKLNLKTGQGQLNMMTNKFKLEKWKQFLPPFEGYALEGNIKILANLDGNLLQRPEEVKSMVNMTLEDVTLSRGEDSLRNLSMALDYSPLSIEIKKGKIQTQEEPFLFEFKVYDPATNPKAKAHFESEKIDGAKLLATLESLFKDWLPKRVLKRLQRARQTVAFLVPPGQLMESLKADVEIKEKLFLLHELQFRAYEGGIKLKGQWDFTTPLAPYQLQSEIDRLNLARLFSQDKNKKLVHGNLFLKGEFSGNQWGEPGWKEALTGQGTVSVTNGEFNTFSILESVADIQGFAILMPSAPETTTFSDLQAKFKIGEGKILTENATILSRDFKASADGHVSLDGLLNYRLNVFLSYGLARDILEPIMGNENPTESSEDSFGPIPLLLSGSLERPELETDPSKLAELKDNLSKKKVQKVFRNFLPEEALFKRLKSS